MERLRVIKSYWIGLAGVCIVLSRGLFVFWGFFFLVVLRIFLVSNVGMPGVKVREGVGLGRMSGKKCNRVQTPRCIVALRSPEICARGCTRVLHTTAAKVSSVSLHLLFNYPPLRLYINTQMADHHLSLRYLTRYARVSRTPMASYQSDEGILPFPLKQSAREALRCATGAVFS